MDFKLPEEILADFHKRIDHGIFGYTDPDQEYYDALDRWFAVRHGYHVEPETVTVGLRCCLWSGNRSEYIYKGWRFYFDPAAGLLSIP